MKNLSIIVSNISGELSSEEFLPSIIDACERYKGKKEILFVLQNHKDNTEKVVSQMAKHCSFVRIIKPRDFEHNLSPKTLGAKQARGDVLFFVDDNVELEPEFFEKAGKHLHKNFFILSTCGYNYYSGKQQDGIKILKWKKGNFRFSENILNRYLKKDRGDFWQSFAVQGAYFFVDARRFRLLGGFDDALFKDYLLEADLAYRGLKRGWDIIYLSSINAYHKTNVARLKYSKKLKVTFKRNRYLFVWKNVRSFRLSLSHMVWNILKMPDFHNWKAYFQALSKLGIVSKRRKIEKKYCKVSDMKILKKSKKQKESLLKKSYTKRPFNPHYRKNYKRKLRR